MEANLADSDVTQKARIYHTLAELNSLFAAIVGHCQALKQTGIVPAKVAHRYQGFTQELQSDLNADVLEPLNKTELTDLAYYGKVRQRWEEYLRAEPRLRKKTRRTKSQSTKTQRAQIARTRTQ
jgi:hypothetical protein